MEGNVNRREKRNVGVVVCKKEIFTTLMYEFKVYSMRI